ncbi:hypothetical protein Hte_000248 [Hypoxylon texense]
MPELSVDGALLATAADLQELLVNGKATSVEIVQACLGQVKAHDAYLKAMLQTAPNASETASILDEERKRGHTRGPLHGIPILIKDNIETGPELGMDTTAGSFALMGSEAYGPAPVVTSLRDAGMVVIGALDFRQDGLRSGGNVNQRIPPMMYNQEMAFSGIVPGGSSTGSAVGVSAGYAPAAIGTDTTGSVIIPATRAALYGIRVTTGAISMDGVIPFSRMFDSIGVMSKNVVDMINILNAIKVPLELPQFNRDENLWSTLKIGVLAPENWTLDSSLAKPNGKVEDQLIRDTRTAYEKIANRAEYLKEVELIAPAAVEGQDGELGLWDIFRADFQSDMNTYLQQLKSSKVRTLEDIVQFNKKHASMELPEGYASQDLLESALIYRLDREQRHNLLTRIRTISTEGGIEKTLEEHSLDAILGPADSAFNLLVCGGGYPSATMPLSYLEFNNRPTGVFAIARRNDESTLLRVMRAWEQTFPARKSPARLM